MNLKANLRPGYVLQLSLFILTLLSHYIFNIKHLGIAWTLVCFFGHPIIQRRLLAVAIVRTLLLGGSLLSGGGMIIQGCLAWEARGFGRVWIVQIVEYMQGMLLLAGLVDILTFISR